MPRFHSFGALCLLQSLFYLTGVQQYYPKPQRDLQHHHAELGDGAAPAKLRAMLATMHFPGNKLPVDTVLAHQIRMLRGGTASIQDVVILDNRPPWLNVSDSPQDEVLTQLRSSGSARIKLVDYSLLHDTDFLGRYFSFEGGEPLSVAALLDRPLPGGSWYGPEATSGEYLASNFLGVLEFLEECRAAEDVELCVYLDPDIFLYRFELGLLDAAASAFELGPGFVWLEPPTVCHTAVVNLRRQQAGASAGACWAHRWPMGFSSTRHMILHRSRIMKVFPVHIKPDDFNATFEIVWGRAALQRQWVGWLACAHETFAVHPPSRFEATTMKDLDLFTLLARQAASRKEMGSSSQAWAGEELNSSAIIAAGTQVFVDRLEAGLFERPSWIQTSQGNCGGKEYVAVNWFGDLVPSASRIQAGLAW